MNNELIMLPDFGNDSFVFVPSSLNYPYLNDVISRSLGKELIVSRCIVTNLCPDQFGRVSNSGATLLRLSLEFGDGKSLDMVAKILSPDSVNIFKIDRQFNSRIDEIAWAEWWGRQNVSWVPVVYDARADSIRREFWILREYSPEVGWCAAPTGKPGAIDHFFGNMEQLRILFKQVAVLHSYSRNRINDLSQIFSANGERPGGLYPPSFIQKELARAVEDSSFLSKIGVTEDERSSLALFCETIGKRPAWVDQWDVVCITSDWQPYNIGIRNIHRTEEIVILDWGTTRLAPMEEEMVVLLRRLEPIEEDVRKELVSCYLQAYGAETGHCIDYGEFMSRIPWASFLVNLRYLIGHLDSLRWVSYQTRSREFVHLFIDLARRAREQCRT